MFCLLRFAALPPMRNIEDIRGTMQVYLARQPIFTHDKKIFAYELLFRGGMANYFPDIDGNSATSRVLSNTFFSSDIEHITGGKKAFINFTYELLELKIPLLFSSKTTTIEILEDVIPDKALIASCAEMSAKGYLIALDDFEYDPALEPLIDLADFIKIDFIKSTHDEIRDYIEKLSGKGVKFLAEKIETYEEFQTALDLGFTYFQGYFFSKPQVMQETDIPSLKMNLLQIMTEANKDDFRVSELQKLIERDVGISYKLLRYLNSPFFRRRNEVSSIKQAIVMLGENGIKRFLSVIILAELSYDKPDELLKSSIVRAKICESLAIKKGAGVDPSELFTLGLFSLIDAILDSDMKTVMKKLPLSEEIKRALLKRDNRHSEYLKLTESYEQGDWEAAAGSASALGIDMGVLPAIYFDALGWADALLTSRND